MTLITKFYYFMEWPSLKFVQCRLNGRVLHISVNGILEFLGVSNEDDVTHFENSALAVLFKIYVPNGELEGKVLKPGVTYKNPLNAKDLTNFLYTFW